MLARIAIGDIVTVNCDGCPRDITAPVTFISRSAEFTPPVIYSLEERSKLVYLVEARPEETDMLRVGQPVDVTVTLARDAEMTAASDIAIDVHGLTKSFDGRMVVRDLSMQVKRGTIYGFLGPNGSGKTTTIRMLCGLLTPDKGEGTCLGYDIRTAGRRDQAACRLHDAALQPLSGSVGARESRIRRAALWPRRSGRRRARR